MRKDIADALKLNMAVVREGYEKQAFADNGNRFLTGNGYMGIRGTLTEARKADMPCVNLAGIHHRKGNEWMEPLNAPNPLYFALEGYSLPENADKVVSHTLSLDMLHGFFLRETVFDTGIGHLTLRVQRFCHMQDVHLLAARIWLCSDTEMDLKVHMGIDRDVWDIHGPHFSAFETEDSGECTVLLGLTDDGQQVASALHFPPVCAASSGEMRSAAVHLFAKEAYTLDLVSSVFTSKDTPLPSQSALDALNTCPAFDALLTSHKALWASLWEKTQVEISGDKDAELAMRNAIYHLLSNAPRHASDLSVAARGLSGQTYKGAIFWDTEMFMLDFYLACLPEVARSCLNYRIQSLPGALEKAKAYGLEGAFYAWESVEGGKDACSDYNVTDVFTGRPMRTFFRDKQVHITADIVYGLRKYVAWTGDTDMLAQGGARVVYEAARFYLSLITRRLLSDTYDLLDVIGPDEYHERVNNNAYTNEMARMTLSYAADICPKYLDIPEEEIRLFREAASHLKVQAPDPETGVIAQFDGYLALEDVSVETVRSRLLDPKEYWGGAYGVASHTQVIKQADVIALLEVLPGYDRGIKEKNYDYYEKRTEHGSSLSACMYALCACDIGRPEAAYPLFMKSAQADIAGGGKQWAGLVYIGGTHPAAAGGAYMVLTRGFLGLTWENGEPQLHPRLPAAWERVRLKVQRDGKTYMLDTEEA
ncbi:MAG: glycoside hydrolase family 65 protein [Clostridia bacterium]|nr:glycoside hydrolase family 65 protein [Clostridia bacterium]